jgi:hypothetical protein
MDEVEPAVPDHHRLNSIGDVVAGAVAAPMAKLDEQIAAVARLENAVDTKVAEIDGGFGPGAELEAGLARLTRISYQRQ